MQSTVYERLTRLIATRLAPLAMTDRDVSLTLNMTQWKILHVAFFVIASVSVAINRQRIPQKKRAQSYGEAIAQRRFGFHNLFMCHCSSFERPNHSAHVYVLILT